MKPVLLSWALKGDEVKHIDEVENGISCNCTCPSCGDALIAKNRGEVKRNHFAHSTDIFCAGAGETALHIAAKNIICSSNEILTPAFIFPLDFEENVSTNLVKNYGELSARRISYDDAQMEITVRNFRPDILLTLGDKKIYIEITVTNKTKRSKILDFQKNGDLLFEINLNVEDDEFYQKDAFIKNLLFNSKNRKWLVLSNLDIEKRDKSHEFEKRVYESKLVSKSKKYLFSNNSIEFNKQLKEYISKFTKNDKRKVVLFLEDLTELNNALNKEWREHRIRYLYEKDLNEIKKTERIASEKKVPSSYFAPRISNIWALDTHSKIWQFNFVNHFLIKRKIASTIYLDQVVDWLSSSYPLVEFVKRLGNLNYYAVDKNSDLYDMLNEIIEIKKNIPYIPSYTSIAKSYLDELNRRGLISHKSLAKYVIKDMA